MKDEESKVGCSMPRHSGSSPLHARPRCASVAFSNTFTFHSASARLAGLSVVIATHFMKSLPAHLIALAFATPLALGAGDPFAELVRPTEPLTPEQERAAFHLPPGV